MKLTDKTKTLITQLILLERNDVYNTDILNHVLKENKYTFIQKNILNDIRDKNIKELKIWYGVSPIEKEPEPFQQVNLRVDLSDQFDTYAYYVDKIHQSCGVPKTYVDGKEVSFTLFKDPPI